MNLLSLLSSALILMAMPAVAGAEIISNFNATVTSGSPTELGRFSRSTTNPITFQTWTGAEVYPGIVNTGTTYNYMTYTFAASSFVGAPYVDISAFDSLNGAADFVTAYAGAYNPASRQAGWLGDEGQSGNSFGPDARFFEVILPVGQDLVIVVNNTAPGAGLNDPINIEVDAYADTMYDDPIPAAVATPEPPTLITLGTGLLGVAGAWRRRLKAKA